MPHDFESQMALWPLESSAAVRACNSISWRRARQWRAHAEAEHREVANECKFDLTLERYLWAKLVVQTRAICTGAGHGLFPLIDLANHRSLGATARLDLNDDCLQLFLLNFRLIIASRQILISVYRLLFFFEKMSIFHNRHAVVYVYSMADRQPVLTVV